MDKKEFHLKGAESCFRHSHMDTAISKVEWIRTGLINLEISEEQKGA
jgi:hypothetical protein